MVSDDGAPGDPGLRRDHHVPPDLDVVRDLDQVVDLRSGADARRPERSPVDGGVGADFDVIPRTTDPTCGNFQ
jgi:hypothetical protein